MSHAPNDARRQPTLSSESVNGRRPDDDFDGNPNKKLLDSTNHSPFA